jgi:hypothetical protein
VLPPVDAAVGVVVAAAMDSNRLTTSVQLLPALFWDSFGSGWHLLGRAMAGAIVLARRARRGERRPAAGGLSLLAGASVIALASRCRHVRMPGCPRTR